MIYELQLYNIELSGIRTSVRIHRMGTSMSCSQKQKLRKHIINSTLKHKKINTRNKQIEANKQKTKQKYHPINTSSLNKNRVNQIYKVYGDDFIDLPNEIPSIQLHSEILNPPKIQEVDEESSSQVQQYMLYKNNEINKKCQKQENGHQDIKQLKTALSQFYQHSSSNEKKIESICMNQHQNKLEQKLRSQSSSERFNIQAEKSINRNSQKEYVQIVRKQDKNKSQKQRSQSNHMLSQIIQQRQIKYNTINYDQVRNQMGISVNSGHQFHHGNNNVGNQPRRLSDNTYNYRNYAVKGQKGQKDSIKMRNSNENSHALTQYGFQYPLTQKNDSQNKKILQNKIQEFRKSRQIRTLSSKLKGKDIIKQVTESITYKLKQQRKKQQSGKHPCPQIYHPKEIKNSITKHSYNLDEYQLRGYTNRNEQIGYYSRRQQDLKIKRSMSTNDSIDRSMYRPRKLLFF